MTYPSLTVHPVLVKSVETWSYILTTYIQKYIQSYIHTYIHTYIPRRMCFSILPGVIIFSAGSMLIATSRKSASKNGTLASNPIMYVWHELYSFSNKESIYTCIYMYVWFDFMFCINTYIFRTNYMYVYIYVCMYDVGASYPRQRWTCSLLGSRTGTDWRSYLSARPAIPPGWEPRRHWVQRNNVEVYVCLHVCI